MNIYNKLNNDIQEKIDKIIWLEHKQPIPTVELFHRKLYYLLEKKLDSIYFYHYDKSKVLKWFCWEVVRNNIYGQLLWGMEYDYKHYYNNSNNYYPLYKHINLWIKFLETDNPEDMPDFEELEHELKLAVYNWSYDNIGCGRDLQKISLKLGFNIPSMYDKAISTTDECLYDKYDKILSIYASGIISNIVAFSFETLLE